MSRDSRLAVVLCVAIIASAIVFVECVHLRREVVQLQDAVTSQAAQIEELEIRLDEDLEVLDESVGAVWEAVNSTDDQLMRVEDRVNGLDGGPLW